MGNAVLYLLQPRTNHGFRHMEGPSTTFGTSLSYHAICILGMGASGRDHGSWPFPWAGMVCNPIVV